MRGSSFPLPSGTRGFSDSSCSTKPRTAVDVNWEVRDLLKAAAGGGRLPRHRSALAEALLEARKFDAFNRMSAFVVHDLKNLVAQLSLMLQNAERHA